MASDETYLPTRFVSESCIMYYSEKAPCGAVHSRSRTFNPDEQSWKRDDMKQALCGVQISRRLVLGIAVVSGLEFAKG